MLYPGLEAGPLCIISYLLRKPTTRVKYERYLMRGREREGGQAEGERRMLDYSGAAGAACLGDDSLPHYYLPPHQFGNTPHDSHSALPLPQRIYNDNDDED